MVLRVLSAERSGKSSLDIAGLLNMLGRSRDAIDFLRENEKYVENRSSYLNLIEPTSTFYAETKYIVYHTT